MNKKILSIIVCLAMLISALAVSTYAATIDIEIDLGGDFFGGGDDDVTVGTGGEGPGTGNGNESADDNDDKTENDNGETPKDDDSSKNDNKGSSQSRYEDLVPDKKEEESEQPKEWVNNFTDVKESDWFYPTVKYVSENGIVNGYEDGTFLPNTSITRAMLVTILYRAAGSPRIESDSKFSDVEITDWFGASVIWASENGIVNGYEDGTFLPNNNITREQIATIVYRYAKTKGYDVALGGIAVREYEDYEAISSWAREAMQWAVNTKLITGKTATTVNPLDNATRAEAATIIMRFIEANK